MGRDTPTVPARTLTPREEEILVLVVAGLANKQIARHLGISMQTVRQHLMRAYLLLGARNRAHAAALWLQATEDLPDHRPALGVAYARQKTPRAQAGHLPLEGDHAQT